MITGHTVSLMQYLVIFKIAKLKAKFMLNNTAFEQVLNMLTASVLTSPVLLDKSCTWELDWPNSSSSSIMLSKDSISSAVYLQWMLPCRVLWKIQTFCCGNFISHFYFFFFFFVLLSSVSHVSIYFCSVLIIIEGTNFVSHFGTSDPWGFISGGKSEGTPNNGLLLVVQKWWYVWMCSANEKEHWYVEVSDE